MDAQEQGLEVEPVGADDHDLAVDDAALRQRGDQRGDELREVPVHGLLVAALQQDLVAVAEDQRSKAVPLGLELPSVTAGQGLRRVGQHGRERRRERQAHASILQVQRVEGEHGWSRRATPSPGAAPRDLGMWGAISGPPTMTNTASSAALGSRARTARPSGRPAWWAADPRSCAASKARGTRRASARAATTPRA